MSHLLQMRGLKLIEATATSSSAASHLLQMRGLKPCTDGDSWERVVASFTDAWIETYHGILFLYLVFMGRIFYRCVD